jgi:hypothetical protein
MSQNTTLREKANTIRARARHIRTMAATLSLRSDRDTFEAHAAELDRDADRLEAEAREAP